MTEKDYYDDFFEKQKKEIVYAFKRRLFQV